MGVTQETERNARNRSCGAKLRTLDAHTYQTEPYCKSQKTWCGDHFSKIGGLVAVILEIGYRIWMLAISFLIWSLGDSANLQSFAFVRNSNCSYVLKAVLVFKTPFALVSVVFSSAFAVVRNVALFSVFPGEMATATDSRHSCKLTLLIAGKWICGDCKSEGISCFRSSTFRKLFVVHRQWSGVSLCSLQL